jgi:hypothetical protein
MQIWERCIEEPIRDWREIYELHQNYDKEGMVFDIVDGKLVKVPSKYSWSAFVPSHATYMDDDYNKKFCKKMGLKCTIFDSIIKVNLYCVSLGYSRIGDFMNAHPGDNYFISLDEKTQTYIPIHEKWGKNDKGEYGLLDMSLDRFE